MVNKKNDVQVNIKEANNIENRTEIGRTIREIREKRGLSQEQLADKMNISRSTISKIESGKFNCSIDYLSKFATTLGFDLKISDRAIPDVSTLKQNITIEEVDDKRYMIRMFEPDAETEAIITHYYHNKDSALGDVYRKNAVKYIQNILQNKCPEEDITYKIAEEALQYGLFDYFQIPFPPVNNPTFTFIDLFAGIGGFRLASQKLGGKCVYSSEWDAFSQKTYKANFGEVPFGDITKPEIKNYIPENYDILFAGFPCQPFSYAGLLKGFEETRGTLFFDILDILEKTKPRMFLLENVKGLVSHDKGNTLEVIEHSLRNLGYNIKWKILNSYDFGLPQYRERWYCVGFQDEVNFEFPVGDSRGAKLKNIVDESAHEDPKLKLTDFEIERIKFHFNSDEERVKHDNSKYSPNTKKGKHGVYSFQKADGALRFHIGDVAKTQIQEAFYACLDTYAPTIIANRVPKLWDIQRKLSVKEAQRLQGYPDEFIFPVSDNQAYKQLGNSIAVPVVQAVINQMLKTIKL